MHIVPLKNSFLTVTKLFFELVPVQKRRWHHILQSYLSHLPPPLSCRHGNMSELAPWDIQWSLLYDLIFSQGYNLPQRYNLSKDKPTNTLRPDPRIDPKPRTTEHLQRFMACRAFAKDLWARNANEIVAGAPQTYVKATIDVFSSRSLYRRFANSQLSMSTKFTFGCCRMEEKMIQIIILSRFWRYCGSQSTSNPFLAQ